MRSPGKRGAQRLHELTAEGGREAAGTVTQPASKGVRASGAIPQAGRPQAPSALKQAFLTRLNSGGLRERGRVPPATTGTVIMYRLLDQNHRGRRSLFTFNDNIEGHRAPAVTENRAAEFLWKSINTCMFGSTSGRGCINTVCLYACSTVFRYGNEVRVGHQAWLQDFAACVMFLRST